MPTMTDELAADTKRFIDEMEAKYGVPRGKIIEVMNAVFQGLTATATASAAPATMTGGAVFSAAVVQATASAPAATLSGTSAQPRSAQEKAAAYTAWADSHRKGTPIIPLEAFDRENLYEDDDVLAAAEASGVLARPEAQAPPTTEVVRSLGSASSGEAW